MDIKTVTILLLCVAGVVYGNGATSRLCNLESYDPNTHICCGRLVPINGEALKCCAGNKIYNSSQVCCGNNLYDKDKKKCCGVEAYDKVDNTLDCCKDVLFYGDKGICCNGTVFERKERMCCRDNQPFKLKEGKCGPYLSCGDQEYNPEKEVCCHDTGKKLKLPESKFYSKAQYTCSEGMLIEASTQKLEIVDGNKVIVPKAMKQCGNELYIEYGENSNIQYHCCDDHLRMADSNKFVQCCGAELYNFKKDICCNNTLLSNARPLKCCAGFIPYDDITHDCCQSDIILRSTSLCVRKGFQRSIITKTSTDHDKACFTSTKQEWETYNSKTHYCHENGSESILYKNQDYGKLVENAVVDIIGPAVSDESTSNRIRSGEKQKVLCPFVECTNSNESGWMECRKRNELRFFVYEVRQSPGKSILKAVITYPPKHAGKKVQLRTIYNCDACFEQYASYRLFTNRLTKKFSRKLRFSDQDYLVKEGSEFHCTIDRYAKKQPRKGL